MCRGRGATASNLGDKAGTSAVWQVFCWQACRCSPAGHVRPAAHKLSARVGPRVGPRVLCRVLAACAGVKGRLVTAARGIELKLTEHEGRALGAGRGERAAR